MKRVYVHAARASAGAATLCGALRKAGVRARRLRGTLLPKFSCPVINWGDSRVVLSAGTTVLFNKPEAVALAISKLSTIEELNKAKVPSVRATDDHEKAVKWFDKGYGVLARTDGQSNGNGIELFTSDQKPKADFYSRYWPKSHEYRAHVFNNQVIDLTEKRARHNAGANRVIRSYDNGWIFAHHISLSDKEDRERLNKLALDAIRALGLDFGAVDILAGLTTSIPRRLSKAVVCEVNTSPGLESPQTIDAYVRAISAMMKEEPLNV